MLPPSEQVVCGEVGGVVGGAHHHEAAVGAQVVDAVGDGDAVGLGAEVVVVDGVRSFRPAATGILEVADQFPLLGIDTDDWQVALGEPGALFGDMDELLVTVRAGPGRYPLLVEAQPIAETEEDASHGSGTNLDAAGGELVGDLLGGTVGPANTGDGIAGDIVLQYRFDRGDHLGRFFSTAWRPPPGRRTRSRSTSPESSCWRPRATVPASRPSSAAMRRSPPWPILSDSSAA